MTRDEFQEFLTGKTVAIYNAVQEGLKGVESAKTLAEAGGAYAEMMDQVDNLDEHVLANTLIEIMLGGPEE